jgi:2-polyprenyl-6-methoxyphenol hydroxylase-like FAD-dependent oxidoreductase
MTIESQSDRSHAVVIGGSMAGLLAARVLADHYRRVTLIERDKLPSAIETRRGVPQGRHTHGLLAGGREALDKLFPGISEQLIAAGALNSDIIGESRWFMEGACHCRFQSGLIGLLMSRPFLEGFVRERLRAITNVWIRDNEDICGLLSSADKSRVQGVLLKGEALAADLVVDTSGRGSQSPQWLEAMGYPKPVEERVTVGISYTTRFFRRSPDDFAGDTAIIIPSTISGKRGGVALAQEGGRWTVTLLSNFGEGAPANLKGFIEFARTLAAPYIYELVRRAEPLGEAAMLRFPASIRRRYEKLNRFPEGYLVMGDAISSFNPVYGQGMTAAALQAIELRASLVEGTGRLARRFFVRASNVIDIPWSMAVGNDLRMPETVGPRTCGVKLINAYLAKLHKAAHIDPVVTLAFHRVGNLLAPPLSLMRPRIAWRVLRGNLRAQPRQASLAHVAGANAAHEVNDAA